MKERDVEDRPVLFESAVFVESGGISGRRQVKIRVGRFIVDGRVRGGGAVTFSLPSCSNSDGCAVFSHWKEHRSTCKPPPVIHEARCTAVIIRAKGMGRRAFGALLSAL
jgi:hypothetical protein